MLRASMRKFASKITEDFDRLAKLAAKVGFVIALVCNALPPHYRVVCHTIASICTGGN